jgi:hypothetical protein
VLDADSPEERLALYDAYRLRRAGNTWRREDGKYTFAQLGDVAGQFPASASLYRRAQTRSQVTSGIAGAGGGLLGGTLGWQLGASPENKLSTGAQVGLYTAGGVLTVAALVAILVWHDPSEELGDVYNRALKNGLGLPESSAPANQSRLLPRAVGHGELGWSF